MKKLLITILLSAVLIPSPLFAQSSNTDKKTDQLREKINREIDRRVTGFGKLTTKINTIKKLDTTTKTALTTEISNEITSLQTIKTNIASENDITKLREQVKSLTALHKSYAFYVPRLHILATTDTMQETVELLTSASNALDTQITNAKSAKQDTTSAETALANMRAQTAAAKKQLDEVEKNVLNLTLSGYPANKTDLKNAKKQLDAAHKQIQDTRKAATTIKTELVKSTASSPKVSISPSPAS